MLISRFTLFLFCPFLLYFSASADGSEIQLTANVILEKLVPEETRITLTCTYSRSSLLPPNAGDALRILRKRVTGAIDGFEDMANVASVNQITSGKPDISSTFVVSRKDDGATFICGDAETLGFRSQAPTASLFLRVQFSPRSLALHSTPPGRMREETVKEITCQTDDGGASPPVNITWKHLSPLGAMETLSKDMRITQEVTIGPKGGAVTRSSLWVPAHRRLNGHRIECGVESLERMFLFRQTETLEVLFAPNSVQIHPSVEGGVREGESMLLTCSVAVSHPPATIGWFEFQNVLSDGSETGRELTDLAQLDMTPGEFSGMLVDSTLRISKTFRSNDLTEYRCVVHQAALKQPVITEYKINILYPPSIEIVSLPADPAESLSVTLSCLVHGGSPSDQLQFSWWHARDLNFPKSHISKPFTELNSILAKTLVSTFNASVLEDIFKHMKQITEHSGRHFMVNSVDNSHMGWYGCEVTNTGGTSRNLHLLLVDYAPKMKINTKFIRHAQLNQQTEISFIVDVRPARAEFNWFWLGVDTLLADKARQRILSQNLQSETSNSTQAPDSGRTKRSVDVNKPKAISPSVAPWVGRVKVQAVNSNIDELKISLLFREVVPTDFGIYMCQLNHKVGQREFFFELKPVSTATGIDADSIKISSDSHMTRVEFSPPNTESYSRILLRICSHGSNGNAIRLVNGLVFLKPVASRSIPHSTKSFLVTGGRGQGGSGSMSVQEMSTGDCTDYEVTMAELGYLQVELERPVEDYAFQFLVYQEAQLKQITRPVRWKIEERVPATAASQKFFIQLIIGILTAVLFVCLVVFLIYYACSCLKRKSMKKKIAETNNGMIGGPRSYHTVDGSKHFGAVPSGPGSISADLGSLQPLYPRQSVVSSCQSEKGYYGQPGIALTGSASFQMRDDMHQSHSQNSQMSALTQRILSEVYIAAAKAASIAVSESIASGSIDGVNIQGRIVQDNVSYRPNSHYAESGSITGGSLSGIEGLPGYPGDHMNASLSRFGAQAETISQRSNTPRQRKSPIIRAVSPTLNGVGVFQFGQRRHGGRSSLQGWSPPPPIFTPSATMRLNEAASALAAAAAAAVLEATQDTPVSVEQRQNMPRFVSMQHNQATSSEDGESVNSNSFFSRKFGAPDAGGKLGRKKMINPRTSSLSNGDPEFMLPMLAVPGSYVDPRRSQNAYSRSPEVMNIMAAPPPHLVVGGPWSGSIGQNEDISSKSSPYSDLAGEVHLSTFTNLRPSATQSVSPKKQLDPTTDTLRANGTLLKPNAQSNSTQMPV